MTKNRKVYVLYALAALGILGMDSAFAQNHLHKFGLEISGGVREYGGDRGTRYFMAEKPDYQAVGASFSYYVNSSFDATAYGSYGALGHRDDSYPVKLGFTAQVTDFMFGLRYKFANNYMLKETGRIKPYLQAGYGLMQSVSKIIHDVPGYGQNRTWTAAQWSAGGGARVRLTDFLDFSLQIMYNYTYDDNYDGLPFSLSRVRLSALHDAYLYHTVGFVYNFGDNTSATYSIGDDDEEVPEEVTEKVNIAAKNIEFDLGSSKLTQESYGNLDSIVQILLDFPTIDALVEGHTDNTGDEDDNMELSQKRADVVKEYITSKGIDANRLTAKGYGQTQPIASNKKPEGQAKNRRVEVKLFYRK